MKKGQALLVGLLIIFTAAIAIAVAGAVMASTQIGISQNQKLSASAYNLASSCIEDTLMKMDRGIFATPPNYELSVSSGTCRIEISGSNPYQILSVAEFNSPLFYPQKVTKKIQANVSVANGIVTLTSQQEEY